MAFRVIPEHEMREFLENRGFSQMTIERTSELVWGKLFYKKDQVFSVRVYSSVFLGETRDKGRDSIRVCVYTKLNNEVVPVAKTKNLKRVDSWEVNLGNALDKWDSDLYFCEKCGKPKVQCHNRKTKEKFWGCIDYKNHKT